MANELLTVIEYIEQERGISREVLIEAIENAVLSASRKSLHPASNLKVKFDPKSGSIKAWAVLEVVEKKENDDQIELSKAEKKFPEVKIGDMVDWDVTPSNFGRIAAQAAKQVIMQKLREAEKEIVKEEFTDLVGQIISGRVLRVANGGVEIDFHKAKGLMPRSEKIRGEHYMVGDMISALLLKVDTHSSGPSLIVSRTSIDFVRALFEREVSEIHDGTVEIVAIAREPGGRSKIAVRSNDSRVDAVGACVGMRGMRVKNITNELNGERIDIIPYDEDIVQYAANALQPAKVLRIDVNEDDKSLDIHVSPEQSKLVYGRRSQNIRLSSRLLQWKMNVIVDEPQQDEDGDLNEKLREAAEKLSEQLDTDMTTADILIRNGFLSPEGLKAAGKEKLLSLEGIDADAVEKIWEKINPTE